MHYVYSTINIECQSADEAHVVVNALERIAEMRWQKQTVEAARFAGAVSIAPLPDTPAQAEAFAPPAPVALYNQAGEQIDGQTEVPGPAPAAPQEVPAPSAADVAKAALVMYHSSGFAPVRALIDEFVGEGKRVEDVPAEKRAEFIARATA